MGEKFHIASASDDAYFPGLMVCLDSILAHASTDVELVLHVLDGGIKAVNYERLETLLHRRNRQHQLVRHKIRLSDFEGFLVDETHSSPMAYARLLLPMILDVSRVLYVDSDILVTRNLCALHGVEMHPTACVIAVQDPVISTLSEDCPWPLNPEQATLPYFNTGFMVMDLDKWRAEKTTDRALSLIRRDPAICQYWDQTALNYLLKDQVQYIDQKWNHDARSVEMKDFRMKGLNYHFISPWKPWRMHRPFATYVYFAEWLIRLDRAWSDQIDRMTERAYRHLGVLSWNKRLECVLGRLIYQLIGRKKGQQKKIDRLDRDREARRRRHDLEEEKGRIQRAVAKYLDYLDDDSVEYFY